MSQEMYELQECSICRAAIPVKPEMATVTCGFCGAEYDIINHRGDHQGADHQTSAWTGFFVGGIIGLGVGAIIFTATGRALAVRAISKGAHATVTTVDSWLKTGEK